MMEEPEQVRARHILILTALAAAFGAPDPQPIAERVVMEFYDQQMSIDSVTRAIARTKELVGEE